MKPRTAHRTPEKTRTRVPGDQRKAQLLDAAIRVFSKTGFSGTKTRDIAAEAQVNEALIFRHFPTKDDLYVAILESVGVADLADEARQAMDASGSDARAFFRDFVKRTLGWQRRRPELLRLVLFSALEHHELAEVFRDRQVRPVIDLLAEYIEAGQREGRFKSKLPAGNLARAIFGAVSHQGLVALLLRGAEGDITEDEVADAISCIAAGGLQYQTEQEI